MIKMDYERAWETLKTGLAIISCHTSNPSKKILADGFLDMLLEIENEMEGKTNG